MPENERLTLYRMHAIGALMPVVKIVDSTITPALRRIVRQPIDEALALDGRLTRDAADRAVPPERREQRRIEQIGRLAETLKRGRDELTLQEQATREADSAVFAIDIEDDTQADELRRSFAALDVSGRSAALQRARRGEDRALLKALASAPDDAPGALAARGIWEEHIRRSFPGEVRKIEERSEALEAARATLQSVGNVLARAAR